MRNGRPVTVTRLVAGVVCLIGMTMTADAKFRILHSFCPDTGCYGIYPSTIQGGLLRTADGALYGTTYNHGANNTGSVFQLKRKGAAWQFTTLYDFCCGRYGPHGELIADTHGNLYGTADVVFKLSRTPSGWVLKPLTLPGVTGLALAYVNQASGTAYDGQSPLYLPSAGGGANGAGAILKLTPGKKSWGVQTLYSFCSNSDCSDGKYPNTRLVADASGFVYGATYQGGLGGQFGAGGVVFQVDYQSGIETVLHDFCALSSCADGAFPTSFVMDAAARTLYGTTDDSGDGTHQAWGIIYSMAPNADQPNFQQLYSFCTQSVTNHKGQTYCPDGNMPRGLAAHGGANYGIAGSGKYFGGVLYKYDALGLTKLHLFCSMTNCADGGELNGGATYPAPPVVVDYAGNVFGVTESTVFEYSP